MKKENLLVSVALGISLFSASNANAVLVQTLNGQGVYDTDLNITWLRDANLAISNSFGVSGIIMADGRMNWYTAQSWITAMNNATYLGFNDWRLPTMTDIGGAGCQWAFSGTDCGYNVNTATGEIAHLWYDELGNTGYLDTAGHSQSGWNLQSIGSFTNFQSYYWYGTGYAPPTGSAWGFATYHGYQFADDKNGNMNVWSVRPGGQPVAAVPEPDTYAMLLAGLGVMGYMARRKNTGHRSQT